jgi:type VI secretion system secreted protein VgrG
MNFWTWLNDLVKQMFAYFDTAEKKEPAKVIPIKKPEPEPTAKPAPPEQTTPLKHARIEGAIDYVLANEGGYSDDPADSGGATNWGITHIDLARWRGRAVTKADVKAMTKAEAIDIYRALYWHPLGLDECVDQKIATCIFDIGVNMGIGVGAKFAQLALNNCGFMVQVDGKLGPQTMLRLNEVDRVKFIHQYHGLVVDRYKDIIARKPSQEVFRKGWMRRADRLLTLA